MQLKVLQTLSSLFQYYGDDLNGDLLASALEICATLQSTKTAAVSNSAAATLQQLVVSVFEKVSSADGSCANLISFGLADFLQQNHLISCQQ